MFRIAFILPLALAVCCLAGSARAIEPGLLRQRIASGPPHYPPTENRYAHVPPGHERLLRAARAGLSVARSWPERAHVRPGATSAPARTRPRVVEQHSYYDDYRQWSFRPGL